MMSCIPGSRSGQHINVNHWYLHETNYQGETAQGQLRKNTLHLTAGSKYTLEETGGGMAVISKKKFYSSVTKNLSLRDIICTNVFATISSSG